MEQNFYHLQGFSCALCKKKIRAGHVDCWHLFTEGEAGKDLVPTPKYRVVLVTICMQFYSDCMSTVGGVKTIQAGKNIGKKIHPSGYGEFILYSGSSSPSSMTAVRSLTLLHR